MSGKRSTEERLKDACEILGLLEEVFASYVRIHAAKGEAGASKAQANGVYLDMIQNFLAEKEVSYMERSIAIKQPPQTS